MNAIVRIARQAGWEQKLFWRNPASAAFTCAFPLMFLVIFIAINGNDKVRAAHGRVKFAQYYVPAIVAFGIISACYTNLAFLLSIRRDNGILKRTRGTPLPTWLYLTGIGVSVVIVSALLTALTITLGVTVYGVTLPHRYLALALTIAVGAFCFGACGAAVATFVPNEDAAPAIINFIVFPLLFISGTFGTIANDSTLGRIAAIFPIRHLVKQLTAVFDPSVTGSGINVANLAVMAAWGIGMLLIAARRFKWEPGNL